jgi:hypothetical protein
MGLPPDTSAQYPSELSHFGKTQASRKNVWDASIPTGIKREWYVCMYVLSFNIHLKALKTLPNFQISTVLFLIIECNLIEERQLVVAWRAALKLRSAYVRQLFINLCQ